MAGGRPVEYIKEEVLKNTRAYITAAVDEEDEYHTTRGTRSDSFERIVRVRIPTIEGLAVYLKVSRDTIYDWEKRYEEFSDILSELRAIQADRLITNGLSGDYNPTIAKVLLTKHGYREGVETTGKEGAPIEHKVDITKALELTKEYEEKLKESL